MWKEVQANIILLSAIRDTIRNVGYTQEFDGIVNQ